MAKADNFGGIPSNEFTQIVTTFSTSAQVQPTDKIAVLAELAQEEHAAANSTKDVNVVAAVVILMDIKALWKKIDTSTVPVGPQDITNFKGLLNNLAQLW